MSACPECGARNSPRAEWCTQCLVPLAGPPPPAATGPESTAVEEPPAVAVPSEAEVASSGPGTPSPEPADTPGRRFRTVDGEVEWRCEGCEAWNPLFVTSCPVCGRPMGGTGAASTWSGERVARTRRILWVAAGVVCLLALVAVVVGLAATQGAG